MEPKKNVLQNIRYVNGSSMLPTVPILSISIVAPAKGGYVREAKYEYSKASTMNMQ